ncbi:hypothetical protein AMJ85_07910 [candidate division BRC1 bacterium SM23_51]|nr:MAG: hypothetical protein AMJ85_07910 [candidate division BRC1 bacterium SM23_51]
MGQFSSTDRVRFGSIRPLRPQVRPARPSRYRTRSRTGRTGPVRAGNARWLTRETQRGRSRVPHRHC